MEAVLISFQAPDLKLTCPPLIRTDRAEEVLPLSAAGLLKNMPDGHPTLNPLTFPTLIVVGQLDTKEIVDANILFFNTFRERSSPAGTLPSFRVLDDHNHISNVLSIGELTSRTSYRIELARLFPARHRNGGRRARPNAARFC